MNIALKMTKNGIFWKNNDTWNLKSLFPYVFRLSIAIEKNILS